MCYKINSLCWQDIPVLFNYEKIFLIMLLYLKLAIKAYILKKNNSDQNRLGCLWLWITICIENLFVQLFQ